MMLLCLHAYCQDPYYTVINKANGLPSNSIYSLFQDSKGFIWIASDEGLTRYDGFEFKTYISSHQTSAAGNSIKEDKYGRIWYKNFDGFLYYIEHDSLKSLKQNTTIGNAEYAIIDDRILVVQYGGIDIFDLQTLKVIRTVLFEQYYVISQTQSHGHFYSAKKDTLLEFSVDGSVKKIFVPLEGSITGSKNGIILLTSDSGEHKCYEIIGNEVQLKFRIPDVNFIHGFAYCGDLHWVFTPASTWVYNAEGICLNQGKPYFSGKRSSCVMKDREGNIWLGTINDGILLIPDFRTKLITTPGCIPNTLTKSDGLIFIGSKDHGVFAYDVPTNTLNFKFSEPVSHETKGVVVDTANKKYLVLSRLFIITDDKFKIQKTYTYPVKEAVVVDRKYCAMASSGFTRLLKISDVGQSPWDSMFNARRTEIEPTVSKLIDAVRSRTLAYNAVSGTIYTASNKGLQGITPHGVFDLMQDGNALYVRRLVSMGSMVYALTQQSAVLAIDRHNKIVTITIANEGEKFLNIRKASNSLYLVTGTGIRVLDTNTSTFKAIGLHPGIRGEEINDFTELDDKMIFASDRGLVIVDKFATPADTVAPGFVVNSILVNGNKVPVERLRQLSYKEKDIEIAYSILSFSANVFQYLHYRINDGKWQRAPAATRTLKLVSLSPGDYQISFRLMSTDGRVYDQPEIRFTIRRPFWTQWWFWGAWFIALSAGGYAYYKWQTTILKRQNALVVEKVELEKNLRSSMLTSIRAQMNPHFFYNALNTIQSFIFSDEKRNASTYLVKLSKLTRLILEMSAKEAISLDEEVEALKLYLELEKMRFQQDFEYEIKIGSGVDTDLLKIPSMIVQPYVENAIKHGLLHKKGFKTLSIEFIRINGNLCITIDDNGIGRAKASELNQAKKEHHNSFATEANSKRIELLNKERDTSIGVFYIDKQDDTGEPAGTTVIISIPLI